MPENFAKVAMLKKQYTDQYVEADASIPQLLRFEGKAGRVVTVNENMDALVDFGDGPWYDIALQHLKVVPKPEVKEPTGHAKPAAKPAEAKPAAAATAPAAGATPAAKPAVAKPAAPAKPSATAKPADSATDGAAKPAAS